MRLITLPILATCFLIGSAAWAERDLEKLRYDPAAAHAEVDKNGDGQIDREEFHLRMVEIYFHGDRDKDGYMSPAELAVILIYPKSAEGADRNNDGRISLHEFVNNRFSLFTSVDTNLDGMLSVPEVVGAWKRGELQ